METDAPPAPGGAGSASPHGAPSLDPSSTAQSPVGTPADPRAHHSLTSRTASGFAWAVGQTVLAKAVTVACQLILARLLLKQDFGLVAIAAGIASFVAVLQYAGLQEILVQRHARFDRWRSAAFWMSACIGLASALLVAASGPIAARIWNEPRLTPLLTLTGLGSLIAALQIVPNAILLIELRMRTYSSILLLQSVASTVASVLLALAGAGPYSLVLGPLFIGPVMLAVLWALTRPVIRAKLQVRRWKYMFADSALLFGTGMVNNVTNQGANLLLGWFHPASVVGVYSVGFNLSLQTVTLLTQNLSAVFFPALSKLQSDPERMRGAFVRAASVLALIGMPLCALQAALAEPVIHLLYHDKWDDAIPVVQWLSLGLAFGILGSVSTSLVKAAGMFRYLFWITVGYTTLNVAFTCAGAILGGAREVAIATAVYFAIAGPVGTWLVLRPFGGNVRDIARIYAAPTLCSAAAFAAALWSQQSIPMIHNSRWIPLVTTPLLGAAIYLPLTQLLAPAPLRELRQRIREFNRTL